MRHTLVLLQVLLLLLPAVDVTRCDLTALNTEVYFQPGHLIIGGIVPVNLKAIYSELTFTNQPKLLRCETFFVEAYQYTLAMVFAINEINQSPTLLPNITLGFSIFDSCYLDMKAMQGTMALLSGQRDTVPNYSCQAQPKMTAVIGDTLSSSTVQVARLLGIYRIPQISYASSLSYLSNKLEFPAFLRTVPNNNFQSAGLARLVTHFGWTWIGIIASDNDFGQVGALTFYEEVRKLEVCVDFFETFPVQNPEAKILKLVQIIKKSSVKAIVIYVTKLQVIPLMEAFLTENVSGKVWLGVTSWSAFPAFVRKELWSIFHGTIVFALHEGAIPGFSTFLSLVHPSKHQGDIFINSFWENVFACRWTNNDSHSASLNSAGTKEQPRTCTGEELVSALDVNIYDIHNSRAVYSVYTAVYAVALGLHHLLSSGRYQSFDTGTWDKIMTITPWKLLHHIRNVVLHNSDGDTLFFDHNGDFPAIYDILNWQLLPDHTSRFIKVGQYDSTRDENHAITINVSAIIWSGGYTELPRSVCTENCPPGHRRAARLGQPTCCFDCIPCPAGEISNQTDAAECVKCQDHLWPDEGQKECIAKRLEFLSYQEPLGATLASISISFAIFTFAILCIFLNQRNTPIVRANNRALSYLLLLALVLCFLCSLIFIGKPQRETCTLRQVVFAVVFTVCVSTILAKTITVIIAFSATRPGSRLRLWMRPRVPFYLIVLCSCPQIIICIVWLTTCPPFVEYNMKSELGKITIECNESSFIIFYCVLGYLGFLSSISFIIAFLARRLPDSFNEAKMITFSMLVFCSVWLLFVPTYLSTRGKYVVAEEVFAILSSSTGVLCCIFFPKLYIILLRPEMNSREHLIGRSRADSTL